MLKLSMECWFCRQELLGHALSTKLSKEDLGSGGGWNASNMEYELRRATGNDSGSLKLLSNCPKL